MSGIIRDICPECGKESNFTNDCSLTKTGIKTVKSIFSFNRIKMIGNIAKDAVGLARGEGAKNYECLSCGEVVHQCPSCKKMLKYFNTGRCSACGQRIC